MQIPVEKELRRGERLGINDLSDLPPHPDLVKNDMIEGAAAIAGPATKEEKAGYGCFAEWREVFADKLQHLQNLWAESADIGQINQIDEAVGQIHGVLQTIDAKLPDWVPHISSTRTASARLVKVPFAA